MDRRLRRRKSIVSDYFTALEGNGHALPNSFTPLRKHTLLVHRQPHEERLLGSDEYIETHNNENREDEYEELPIELQDLPLQAKIDMQLMEQGI